MIVISLLNLDEALWAIISNLNIHLKGTLKGEINSSKVAMSLLVMILELFF